MTDSNTIPHSIPRLYKRDTKGKLRVWAMEQQGSRHRTWSGLLDGAITVTDWTQCQPTNVGRANERNAEQQAEFECASKYVDKQSGEYHDSIEATEAGAHFFMPMLAEGYDEFWPGFAQPKLDGVRCIGRQTGMWSRKGKPLPGAPHIFEALAPYFRANPSLIFDGELYNHEFKDDFNSLVSLIKKQNPDSARLAEIRAKVEYHVYDLPSHPGTFSERFEELERIVETLNCSGLINSPIVLVDTARVNDEKQYDKVHGICLGAGYEGSIHRLDAPYENKRTKSLKKRKEKQDAEFKLVRVEPGLGNWSNAAKRAICQLPDGREFGAGIKGSMERGVQLLTETHEIVTVEFFEYTPDGIPRFPIATKFHGTEKI